MHLKTKRNILVVSMIVVAIVAALFLLWPDFGFHTAVTPEEEALRLQIVKEAEKWLDTTGGSDEHRQILQIYNGHEPLAQGYAVQPEDAWCATFVSAVAIQCNMTDIIPTECGCQRQIGLWSALGRWEESDDYLPLPGDVIYYCIAKPDLLGDCTGHSDHVGIVVGTWGGYIKVIEGNCNNRVAYRYIPVDSYEIRGFGLPDYRK